MNYKSAIYSGKLHHRRTAPKLHDFQYSVTYYYLDLSEIDHIFKIPFFFSTGPFRLFGFDRKKYLAGAESLDTTVRDLIRDRTGKQHAGPIRMLTHITYFGYCFNPVTFYYCFDVQDQGLDFIVVEITNTPWKERKSYVFDCSSSLEFHFQKDFHVSPFFPMNLHYHWRFKQPTPAQLDSRLNVFMEDWDIDQKNRVFFANLTLAPRPLTAFNILKNLIGFPFMTFKTVAAIYFQALRLFLKRIPFFNHPHPGDSP